MKMRTTVYVIAILLVALAAPARADFKVGHAAYKKGDFATALKEMGPLAEQGHFIAQFNLGLLYDNGQGVKQDHQKAAYWYRRSAKQGHSDAQNNLGRLYFTGKGVPKDLVQAYKWASLAADQGNRNAAGGRDFLATKMTPQQISEARRLAKEFKPKME